MNVASVITAPSTRTFSLTAPITSVPRGKQRQIVLAALQQLNRPCTAAEIAEIWSSTYTHVNVPVGGILPSVKYHLHQLELTGIVS